MTKQKLYAARKQSDVYAITEEMKEAARKRYNEQRTKRSPKEKKEKHKEAPVVVAKKKK
jgi:hypothetical protein